MKRLILLAVVLGCGGCSLALKRPYTQTIISWLTDGNPDMPVCVKNKLPTDVCKSTVDAVDNSTQKMYTVPVTKFQITVPYGGTYSVRTSGIDKTGTPVHSYWEAVP